MFEIDKEQFGEFLSVQRRKKGFTQKELAERLFISDKAVSKWETGKSMPDISLLIPLADILGVTVTELLEGREMAREAHLDTGQVENLVKKALTLSGETPERVREKKIRRGLIFFVCCIVVILELLVFLAMGYSFMELLENNTLLYEGLSLGFGAYFWLGIKERLPVYYDENRISAYSDGVFRMNMPGICFNNSNWPYIVRTVRIWSVFSAAVLPVLLLLLSQFFPGIAGAMLMLAVYLGGLFIPVYIVGKKYE